MLLENYTLELFSPKCLPGAVSLHCFAHFEQDVSPALPYLHAVLGGFSYIPEIPSLTLKIQGKLITVTGDKAAITALKDEAEAKSIVEWLKREINEAWEKRNEIEPCCQETARPQLFEILKLLPKTNCRKCGQPTCTVFAAQAAEGGRGPEDCPELSSPNREKLAAYLAGFTFD